MARYQDGPEQYTYSPNRPEKLKCWACYIGSHSQCIAPRCACRTQAHPLRPRKQASR